MSNHAVEKTNFFQGRIIFIHQKAVYCMMRACWSRFFQMSANSVCNLRRQNRSCSSLLSSLPHACPALRFPLTVAPAFGPRFVGRLCYTLSFTHLMAKNTLPHCKRPPGNLDSSVVLQGPPCNRPPCELLMR